MMVSRDRLVPHHVEHLGVAVLVVEILLERNLALVTHPLHAVGEVSQRCLSDLCEVSSDFKEQVDDIGLLG